MTAVRPGLPWSWGATRAERDADYPCEELVPDPAHRMIRAVPVDAPPATVYRWLCQLRLAPYSYDVIDNRGRRSPRALAEGADRLEEGAPFLSIFQIAAFVPGREITGIGQPGPTRRFGPMACTYRVLPAGFGTSRLIGRLDLTDKGGLLGVPIAWGDLVMMRKQLRTLAALAEQQHHVQDRPV